MSLGEELREISIERLRMTQDYVDQILRERMRGSPVKTRWERFIAWRRDVEFWRLERRDRRRYLEEQRIIEWKIAFRTSGIDGREIALILLWIDRPKKEVYFEISLPSGKTIICVFLFVYRDQHKEYGFKFLGYGHRRVSEAKVADG